ncbi:MAG: dihydropteroate synthase [Candidatus Pedobacter colombiensis]|uniref:dihydropteroate synthase n=1 Tax=Candidatus Pedobacter colombiensis TaxID=3121371 RepID=A0AAJ6B6B3_9SPHI|nr:dihydropteroate synthase [Pedobacter sp.]WEK18754.1 MAG: dihydropteroate synthase [Pedobacter sp.]
MAKDTFLNRKTTLNLKGKLVDLSTPCVMGILNLTSDSFYSNSRISSIEQALLRAETIINEGGRFIDIGAYSSRPGAAEVSEGQEIDRIVPAVEAIIKAFPEALLSIDTFRAKVAQAAVKAGAHIINDIAAGKMDEAMFETVADLNVPYIMMHMKGTPQTMQKSINYHNMVLEITGYFSDKVEKLKKLGVKDIILDPGFGFAKTLDQNYELLRRLEDFNLFELPVLIGLSRKSMIYKFLGTGPEQALNGTTTLNTIALLKGANILRVHDVKAAAECIALVEKTQQQ